MDLKSQQFTVAQILKLKKNGMLPVNPEYQRGAVWNDAQKKKLIDSVLRGYPLPLIYLHHKIQEVAGLRNEGLEIIDGQQRISVLHEFSEGAIRLFDPIKDDKQARFPNFIKNKPCSWALCDFHTLPEFYRKRFLDTELLVVMIKTDDEDEARDLFIRLQSGLPLNAQEKRDAWPGGFTSLILWLAGKQGLIRYPGHEFFVRVVRSKSIDRGEVRQLCAQICMLYIEKSKISGFVDISTPEIDEYYYRNLDFQQTSPIVERIVKTLDVAFSVFSSQSAPRLWGHEAIHVVLLIDSLLSGYAKGWQTDFVAGFEGFKGHLALEKKTKSGEYWANYGQLTQTQSDQARTIQRRHSFFARKMFEYLKPKALDPSRMYGPVERDIVYYTHLKRCAVCGDEINWVDLEIHHVDEHQAGGQTNLDNAAPVHSDCHPKGEAAVKAFAENWKARAPLARIAYQAGVNLPMKGSEA